VRCVFQGTAGFLGRIDSETRCAFWSGEPVDHGFDPSRLIEVDLANCPSAGVTAHDYECTTVAYWPEVPDPRAGKRYTGHHADIVEERCSLAKVEVYPPGRALRPNTQPVTMWIDLGSADQCDVGPGSLTTVGVGEAPKSGALFLISGWITVDIQPSEEENP